MGLDRWDLGRCNVVHRHTVANPIESLLHSTPVTDAIDPTIGIIG